MTTFASVALFRRDGKMTFRPARREAGTTATQARKSAARHWRNVIAEPDKLITVMTVSVSGNVAAISERRMSSPRQPWLEYSTPLPEITQPHVLACISELGIDHTAAPPAMPDVLEINGYIYRRDI